MAEESPSSSKDAVTVLERPLRYYGMDEVVPIFGELAVVRHTKGIYSLMFFSTNLPITEDRQILESLEDIPAKCVARIALTPEAMVSLHDAIGRNIAKREELIKRSQDWDAEGDASPSA